MLVKLIAVDRIGEEVGEVVVEVELAAHHKGIGAPGAAAVGFGKAGRERVAAGIAPVGRIDRVVQAELSRRDGARRDLIGRVPLVVVGHPGDGEAVQAGALAVAHEAVELAHAVRVAPWAVVGCDFACIEQIAAGERRRPVAEEALVAEAAAGKLRDLLGHGIDEADRQGAHGAEVANVRVVGALADVDRSDQLRDQKVEIRVPLSVRMGAHVDRHVVERDRKIGAVVEVVAAQEILVGFTLAAVLRDHQAGDDLECLARPCERPCVDLRARHDHLARRIHLHRRPAGNVRSAGVVR